ncbi:uncharacterized protein LOC131208879 isoform X1 [Anopheles bellator]|uniref:uncharacterized protein LOC131208879 isoform X1 n=1 Tax=Anopheles bellator TaxID=139047 RepID=UPI0026493AE2|nr:uncharacterized protein LOC131208879 isoform X1 [Anopheles bellator]
MATVPKLSDISAKFTESTLDEIIRSAGGTRCTGWKLQDGDVTKGDAYLSELYRIQLRDDEFPSKDGKPLVVNAIVKTIPKNVGRRNTFRSADFFRNECNFYNVVLKELYRFQDKRQPKHPFQDIARCFVAYCDGENDFIALDDLGQYGYATASRTKGIGLGECLNCMRSLGRFHALSMAMKDQEPEWFQRVANTPVETYYCVDREAWFRNFMQRLVPISRNALELVCTEEGPSWDGFKRTVEHFLDSNIYQTMIELTHARNRNSVVNHGDCWAPNFLLHSESVRMIDFQMARYASPALDIALFVYTCTDQNLRLGHYYELLEAYHCSLRELLRELGSNPDQLFTRNELNRELEQFGRFGCGIAVESIPMSLLDDTQVPDLNSIQGTEAVPLEELLIVGNIASAEGRRRLVDVYRHAFDCGYLK